MTATHHEMANAIRFLAVDAVQAANSGHPGMPMGMADVATVRDGAPVPAHYVWHGLAAKAGQSAAEYPAVTIAVTKKPGENAVDIATAVIDRLDALRGTFIPDGVQATITRNYGATADAKAKLIFPPVVETMNRLRAVVELVTRFYNYSPFISGNKIKENRYVAKIKEESIREIAKMNDKSFARSRSGSI